jgi:hypothetical protein
MVTRRSPAEMLGATMIIRRPGKRVIFQLSPAGGLRQPPPSQGFRAKSDF